MQDLIVVGGGAAGLFGAIQAARHRKVTLIEKSLKLLSKVRVSGGGRCNVTTSIFDPKELVKNYPRGHRELLGPFHTFGPKDTVEWFESRGVPLKVEEDGRIFPISDSSETIIQCLLQEAEKRGVEILLKHKFTPLPNQHILLATGSSPEGYEIAKSFGHTIIPPVPSLFTFNVPTSPLKELSGITVPATLKIPGFTQTGPLLITHFGFSGPAALKLSAFAARYFHEQNYQVPLTIQWIENTDILFEMKKQHPEKPLPQLLPKNLWKALVPTEKRLNDISLRELHTIAEKLHADTYQIEGKTTHKEEFVTCGGVSLKEVNFKTMESKIRPGLFFAGEILDIDGVTGGFNFQNAWTTGFISGSN